MSYKSLIFETLQNIKSDFKEDELAYLALTSKVEFPLRDRLAFQLHEKLFDQGLSVSREWTPRKQRRKRFDLAILSQNRPVVIIEMKAMYSFDAVKRSNKKKYATAIKDDVRRAKEVADNATEIFAILLVTHPTRQIDKRFSDVVKYLPQVNSVYGSDGSPEKALEIARQNIYKDLKNLKNIKDGEIPGGTAFEVATLVYFWMMGPFRRGAA